jgi:hypothetical protein
MSETYDLGLMIAFDNSFLASGIYLVQLLLTFVSRNHRGSSLITHNSPVCQNSERLLSIFNF